MELIRDIDTSFIKQTIVKGILHVADDLGIQIIAEGIETKNELDTLQDFGINFVQGFYFAKPSFESLAELAPDTFPLLSAGERFDLRVPEFCI